MGQSLFFGPVFSRRLKYSLGFSLIPYKTCSMNCVYCEVGRTTRLTVERSAWVPWEKIKRNLSILPEFPYPFDVLTFAGEGEPTLNIYFEKTVRLVKEKIAKPVALLTNSSMLIYESVKNSVCQVDYILASLDAVYEDTFRRVNRPHPKLKIKEIIKALKGVSKKIRVSGSKSELWIEILFVKGINDREEEIKEFKKVLEWIEPHRIQLNTVVRPPAEAWVSPVSQNFLEEVKTYFGENTEIIGYSKEKRNLDNLANSLENFEEMLLNYLKRRPATEEELFKAFSYFPKEKIENILSTFLSEGKIKKLSHFNKDFFLVNS